MFMAPGKAAQPKAQGVARREYAVQQPVVLDGLSHVGPLWGCCQVHRQGLVCNAPSVSLNLPYCLHLECEDRPYYFN